MLTEEEFAVTSHNSHHFSSDGFQFLTYETFFYEHALSSLGKDNTHKH